MMKIILGLSMLTFLAYGANQYVQSGYTYCQQQCIDQLELDWEACMLLPPGEVEACCAQAEEDLMECANACPN